MRKITCKKENFKGYSVFFSLTRFYYIDFKNKLEQKQVVSQNKKQNQAKTDDIYKRKKKEKGKKEKYCPRLRS